MDLPELARTSTTGGSRHILKTAGLTQPSPELQQAMPAAKYFLNITAMFNFFPTEDDETN